MRATAISDGDAIASATWGSWAYKTDAWQANGALHVAGKCGPITVGGSPAPGDLVVFEVFRNAADGSDTLTGDAVFRGMQMQYKELTAKPTVW